MSKKIFLTGATGLIGKETLPFLLENDFKIYALTKRDLKSLNNVNYIKGDLFDKAFIQGVMSEIKPEYLLHFAWYSTGFFDDNVNYEFLSSSFDLLKAFGKNGGKKAVMAGTYAEYGYSNENLKESFQAEPINVYSKCKDFLRQISSSYCEHNDISFGWGRIFSAFGLENDPRRLTSYVINNLLENKEIVIKSGSLVRDYIYVKDVASAFVKFLDSQTVGILNICSGKGTSIHDYVMTIARILGKEYLVKFEEQKSTQQTRVVGDNQKLRSELNFSTKYDIYSALLEIIEQSKIRAGGG